ncbi:MAG: hypothetical protein Q4G07_02940 [Oscillospiraceae bacterium]|nr:hypothetical protein [Oscillospiraceae bacterium]
MASPRYTRNIRPEDLQTPSSAPPDGKKKWENFWYYHKWHVLLGAVGLIVAVMLIYSFCSIVKPDYQITLLSPVSRSSAALEELEKQFSAFGKDLNGDGKVIVQVQQYTLASTEKDLQMMNPQINMAGTAQLQGDAQVGSTVIFLTDDFDALQKKTEFFTDLNDPYAPFDAASSTGVYYLPWTSCLPLSQLDMGSVTALDGQTQLSIEDEFSNTVFCLRLITGTELENDVYFQQYYADCLELFQALTGYHIDL